MQKILAEDLQAGDVVDISELDSVEGNVARVEHVTDPSGGYVQATLARRREVGIPVCPEFERFEPIPVKNT